MDTTMANDPRFAKVRAYMESCFERLFLALLAYLLGCTKGALVLLLLAGLAARNTWLSHVEVFNTWVESLKTRKAPTKWSEESPLSRYDEAAGGRRRCEQAEKDRLKARMY